jgi:hypothetical protein
LLFRNVVLWPGPFGIVEAVLRSAAALDPPAAVNARRVRLNPPVPPDIAAHPALVLARLGVAYFVALLDDAPVWLAPDRDRNVWTCGELLRAKFDRRSMLVDGLVADAGLTVLSGAPKRGKSWLALQIAEAVAAGGRILGREAQQGAAVYLALEDSHGRIKGRLTLHGVTEPLAIRFVFDVPPLDRGGMDVLGQHVAETGARLVIVDTITQARSAGTEENESGPMNALMSTLRRFGQDRGVAVLVVHHNRKSATGDIVADMRGSNAVAAAADLLLGLYRSEGKSALKVEGRDVDACELALAFDRATCSWDLLGDAREIAREESDAAFLDLVDDAGEVDIKGAVEALGPDRTKWQRVAKRLVAAGLLAIRREGSRHVYRRADSPDDGPESSRTPRTPRTDDSGGVLGVGGVRQSPDTRPDGESPADGTRPPPSLAMLGAVGRDILSRFDGAELVNDVALDLDAPPNGPER